MNGGAVMIGRLALIELAPPALACAMEPFPVSVRARDALHLTSLEFLRANGQTVTLASFDERLLSRHERFMSRCMSKRCRSRQLVRDLANRMEVMDDKQRYVNVGQIGCSVRAGYLFFIVSKSSCSRLMTVK